MIPAVNFHLWQPCNMRCHFCFATFEDVKKSVLPKGHLPREQAIEVVRHLAKAGFEKITFAGGEPTLCEWLPELIATAKSAGLTTMIVTNGSRLTDEFLHLNRKHLDWITLSVDSLSDESNLIIGRAVAGKNTLSNAFYVNLVKKINNYGYGLKINTVVNLQNYREDFKEFIECARPSRWKLFQVLPVTGQNDAKVDPFIVDTDKFQFFIDNNNLVTKFTSVVPESNDQMKGSYVMVDPAGRFYNNSTGTYFYSQPILEVGFKKAIEEMRYDYTKFAGRGGLYNWRKNDDR